MEIPKPNTLVTILHKDVPRRVIVDSVSHHKGLMWKVRVQSAEDVYANGDKVYWNSASDEKGSTFVRDLYHEPGLIFFALVAIEG